MLKDLPERYRKESYADVCCRMLTYADVCTTTIQVMLEDLLERYCKASQPEGQDRLSRTTLIWRLPATLIFCLR